jgi:hypothetical protein
MRLDIILPILLLVLIFILKAFVNRTTSLTQLVEAIFELPSDIVFLSLSFISASMIAKNQLDIMALILIVGLIIEVISIVLWRCCIKQAEKSQIFISVLIAILNYVIGILSLSYSVSSL